MSKPVARRRSLQFRMILLFVLLDILLSCYLTVAGFMNTGRIESLYRTDTKEQTILFEERLNEKSTLTKAMASDYSVWDDTYNYLLGKLPRYPEINITDGAISTFQSDAVWLYKNDFTLATSYKKFKSNPDLSQYRKKIEELIAKDASVHFYVPTDEGVLDIYGAAVYPSDGYSRTAKSAGYFFVGRLITQQTVAELKNTTTTFVKLLKPYEIGNYPSELPARSGVLVLISSQKDINGVIVGHVYAKYNDEGLRQMDQLSTRLLWMNGLTFLAFILTCFYAAMSWVVKPINIVYRSLETGDTSHLKKLLQKDTEFGKIALLIDTYFEQQATLEKEIQEKATVLNELEIQSKELLKTNDMMIGRELKMVELKKEIQALKKKTGTD